MLTHLLIRNYALIEHLELSPDPGLNIITGETGAGKSIMLGGIGLLLGNRADARSLYHADRKCIIEGTFEVGGYGLEPVFAQEDLDYAATCIIHREISPSGKSRAFINDTPVNLETLRKVSQRLMDIHSQHDAVHLGTNDFQLQIVDAYAGNGSLLDNYRLLFQTYRAASDHYTHLQTEAARLRKEFDYNHFLFQELDVAGLKEDEQESLEKELNLLEHAAEIREKLHMAYELLDNTEHSGLEIMKEVVVSLSAVSRLFSDYDALRERAQSTLIELKDLSAEIERESERIDVDNLRAGQVRERLDLIYSLLQKHQVKSVNELIVVRDDLSIRIGKVQNLEEELSEASLALESALRAMRESAFALTNARKQVLGAMEEEISGLLKDLGMPNGMLSVEMAPTDPGRNGADLITFLFSANKGVKPQELRAVASGGEFSRLMLAVKYILAGKQKLPTIIFDEIDTGVSGEIALKMAEMISQMAREHQIITITHMHQLATKGESHYFVYKDESDDRTVSRMRRLGNEERVMEIAQMIGGSQPSPTVVRNAREMLSGS